MLDRKQQLIYVGKAKQLRTRLLSYFRENSREVKAGRIMQQTRSILWETAPSEFAALLRELELIRRHRPRFNVQGMPGRVRFFYVCIGRNPAPYAFVSNRPTGKEEGVYGPLVGRAQVQDAVRRLNDQFLLRDCSQRQVMRFSDQPELFPLAERAAGCLRYEIGTCLGPCVGGCTRQGYHGQVRAVKAFLEGRDLSVLDALESRMQEAAASLQFERASALRDKLVDLRFLVDRLTWLTQARSEHSFIYPLLGSDGRVLWYLIHRGQVRYVAWEPTTPAQADGLKQRLEQVYHDHEAMGTAVCPTRVDSILLVASWFRKYPQEREHLLTVGAARERLTGRKVAP